MRTTRSQVGPVHAHAGCRFRAAFSSRAGHGASAAGSFRKRGVRAAKSVLLILGGRDKHGDFGLLAAPIARTTRVVLTIGEAAPKIEQAISRSAPVETCFTLERAVARAAELARPGDTVLLSPACA